MSCDIAEIPNQEYGIRFTEITLSACTNYTSSSFLVSASDFLKKGDKGIFLRGAHLFKRDGIWYTPALPTDCSSKIIHDDEVDILLPN